MLSERGYQVRKAVSGQMALSSCQSAPPDLILLDIKMPEMDGFQVCERLKSDERTQEIPVIFISALDDLPDKVKAFTIGGVDYITKPFQVEEVLARVRSQIALSRFAQELERQVEARTAELMHALKNLQQAQVQLVQSEKMATLGQFVAGFAHEINNPLGCIGGNLGFVDEYVQHVLEHLRLYRKQFPEPGEEIENHASDCNLEFVEEDMPQMVADMQEACNRIQQLSDSLRTFSRADSDRKVPFDLHESLKATLIVLKHRLKATGDRSAIQVVRDYGNLPPVPCYPGPIGQVFTNLIANSIDAFDAAKPAETKAGDSNHYEICIRTEVVDGFARAIVSDNGPGMNPETRQKVFDYLFTTKPPGKGTGLGLSIARQIVIEKHGGRIDCQSEPQQGAAFEIALPLETPLEPS